MLANQVSPFRQVRSLTRISHAQNLFAQYGINYLYHMTSIDNLPSILSHGLLSHNQAHYFGLNQTDISDNCVQDIRQHQSVNDIPLHDYVPLYFNPKNPMLYRRKELQQNIAILAINPIVLIYPQTVFSDGNAACRGTNFYSDIEMLSQLNWDTIWAIYWNDKADGKRIRCAETLVYPELPLDNILTVFCYSEMSAISIQNMMPSDVSIPVQVNRNLYF